MPARRYNPGKYQTVDAAEVSRCGDLRRSHVEIDDEASRSLLAADAQRPEQSDQRQPNQAVNIFHQSRASPDLTSTCARLAGLSFRQ